MANRIANAIEVKRVEIAGKLAAKSITQDQIDKTAAALDMDLSEFAKFQTLKSLAVAQNMLTADEGQTVYVLLGTVPTVFNGQPAHVKAVLTGLFRELLEASIRMKGGRVPARRARR